MAIPTRAAMILVINFWIIFLLMSFIYCPPLFDPDGMKIVKVSCNHSGIEVLVTTRNVFRGVIYTQGNTYNPNCRYQAPDLGTKKIAYFIPLTDCGNLLEEEGDFIYVSNTLIAQKHRIVETSTDVMQKIACKLPVSHFKESQLFSHSRHPNYVNEPELELWMDFYSGTKILGVDKPNSLQLGEEFSIKVNLIYGEKYKDLSVQKCWAHEGEKISTSKRTMEIFDLYKCLNTDLIPGFTMSKGMESISDISAVGLMKAIKFAESSNLHITCTVTVCDNFCIKFCEIPKSKKNTDYPLRVKRSNSESNSRIDLDERHRLMKATIKALGERLINKNRGRKSQNDTVLSKRSDLIKGAFLNSSIQTVPTSQPVIVDDAIGTSEEYQIPRGAQNEVYDLKGNKVRTFNLSNNVIVLPDHEFNFRYEYRNGPKISTSSVAYTSYLVATIILALISSILLITCCCLSIRLKDQKRKNRKIAHDKYMLYSLY